MNAKNRVLALLAILPFVLTACSLQDLPLIGKFFPSGGSSSAPVELSIWGLWEGQDTFSTLIRNYQTENTNVGITYEDRSVLELVDYKERVFERAVDPTGPDIMLVHNSWVPRMVQRGVIVPAPASVMNAGEFSTTFYPVATDSSVIDGQVYAMPLHYDGLVLVYNKNHFEEIGQLSPPTAWEEFRRLALQLTIRGGSGVEYRAGAAMGAADNIDHFSDIIGLMWAQAGVAIPSQIDSKAAQDALTFYTNFLKEDGVWSAALPEASTAFVNNQVSMIIVPSWRLLEILDAVSDPEMIGVAAVPQALPSKPASWGTFWVHVVPKSSAHPEAAWKFINYISQQEPQLALFNEASKVRSFGSPYARVDLGQEIQANPYIGPAVATAPFAKSAEIAGRAGNRRQTDAMQKAVNDVVKGVSADKALITAKAEIDK